MTANRYALFNQAQIQAITKNAVAMMVSLGPFDLCFLIPPSGQRLGLKLLKLRTIISRESQSLRFITQSYLLDSESHILCDHFRCERRGLTVF